MGSSTGRPSILRITSPGLDSGRYGGRGCLHGRDRAHRQHQAHGAHAVAGDGIATCSPPFASGPSPAARSTVTVMSVPRFFRQLLAELRVASHRHVVDLHDLVAVAKGGCARYATEPGRTGSDFGLIHVG